MSPIRDTRPSVTLFPQDGDWLAQYHIVAGGDPIVFHGEGETVPEALRELAGELEAEDP